jgi:hypothetical protein
MRIHFRDKIALSGVTVLVIGVILLIFTFISAYGFLTQSLNIIASSDLTQTFGDALAPLIATAIRIMYLGIMGWVASLVTIRGVTIIANVPKIEPIAIVAKPNGSAQAPAAPTTVQTQQKPHPQPQPQPAKPEPQKETKPEPKPEPKPESKPPEPQIIVLPPEQVTQPPQQTESDLQKQKKNDSASSAPNA